jgi:ACT domain-containing protein
LYTLLFTASTFPKTSFAFAAGLCYNNPVKGVNSVDKVSKAIVTVLGLDRKGIIAGVSRVLYEHNVNILDIAQTVRSDYFNMMMVVDVSAPDCAFEQLSTELESLGGRLNLQIRIQRSDIFEAMHEI